MVELTARERCSLRRLKVPVWWQWPTRSIRSVRESEYRNGDTSRPDKYGRVRLKPSGSCTLPLLEGRRLYRHPENPKMLVVVGEFQSCVHLCGVGTRWRAGFRDAQSIERRQRCRLWLESVFQALRSIRARRSILRWSLSTFPYPPPPLAETNQFSFSRLNP